MPHTVPEEGILAKMGLNFFPSRLKTCRVILYSITTLLVSVSTLLCLLNLVYLNVKKYFILVAAIEKADSFTSVWKAETTNTVLNKYHL